METSSKKILTWLAIGGGVLTGLMVVGYIAERWGSSDIDLEEETSDDDESVDDFLIVVSQTLETITNEIKHSVLSLDDKKRHYLTVLTAREKVQELQHQATDDFGVTLGSMRDRIRTTLEEIDECEELFQDLY